MIASRSRGGRGVLDVVNRFDPPARSTRGGRERSGHGRADQSGDQAEGGG
jgi:hypothetical protein